MIELYDLICVGFGPASLSIAIAHHDRRLDSSSRVLYLEKQSSFAWHAGMLLPGSRMQISFIKDLASLRDPRSHFTFLNYLHQNNRLIHFTNLGTFLPLREEYNDYLTWCASHFDDSVRYGETVHAVKPVRLNGQGLVTMFEVQSTDTSGVTQTRTARHVVVAVGGRPNIPTVFPTNDRRIIHSSAYASVVASVLGDREAPYKVAVIGAGQSAAEIYADLHSRYPNCHTRLIIRRQALKPSDDSPFVNEIFNPEKVDELYSLPSNDRTAAIRRDKDTNYGVVRIELLERLYEDLYSQRLRDPNEKNWAHNIVPLTDVASVQPNASNGKLRVCMKNIRSGMESKEDFDAIIVATGYIRDIYQTILASTRDLLKKDATGCECWSVGRDYKLQYDTDKVADNAGIWLQGCCEVTHGLSDTLLSILAVRGGEMVDSIFGKQEVVDTGRIRNSPPAAVKPIGASSNGEIKVDGYTNGHTNGYTNGTTKQEIRYCQRFQ
ncbi:L-ornithine N5-oxygenase sida [Terfezia claveryi]|nr:L-ornithine N5-oxygenase sida [Terfezia claveryi]